MVTRNEDVIAVDGNQECWWVFESTPEGVTTVQQAEKYAWNLLEALLDLCRGFIRPTQVHVATGCFDPEEGYSREEFDQRDGTTVEIQNQAGVTFDEMEKAVDEIDCEAGLMPFSRSIYFSTAETKLYVDGENRWMDRDSEQLVYWPRDADNQQQAADLKFEKSLKEDPIYIEFHQSRAYDSDEHYHRIEITTKSDIWWADTEPGQVNGHRLWEVLHGIADLDLINDGHMHADRDAAYRLTEDIDFFHGPYPNSPD